MENENQRFKRISEVRQKAKVVNYSALYGVGATKLARETGMSVQESKNLIDTFWEVNWAVKRVAEETVKKTIKDGSIWVFNPVSQFWYNLRFERDAWSTLNQGTGVYVFDRWLALCKLEGVNISLQYHDEQLDRVKLGEEELNTEKLQSSIEKLNKQLNLNVPLAVDVQYGKNYGEVH